ncbi:MAG: O-sialoglycoprotein endopeptidase [Bacillota bacterium]
MFLGLDASCYTTSAALVTSGRKLLADFRKPLSVPLGEKGLQQSAAVFQHLHNLPEIFHLLAREYDLQQIKGVAASTRPRSVPGSYMPVFTVAENQGRIISSILRVPFISTSHQEGHLMAGIWSAGRPQSDRFLAVHLSGGTSEILEVKQKPSEVGFEIDLLGGTTDLHAGQMVDRIGVLLGLPFPSGPYLEQLAQQAPNSPLRLPSSVVGYNFSFSGPESHAARLANRGEEPAAIARAVERCIAVTILKVLRKVISDRNIYEVLVVGGVAANNFVRTFLSEKLETPSVGAKLFFADPKYSSDNAVGIALLAMQTFLH